MSAPAYRGWMAFAAVAALGVATTALNTTAGLWLAPASERMALPARPVLDTILLLHALATLLPVLGLALYLFARAPFAAVLAASLTLIEKLLEFVAQNLRLFPPEEVLGGVGVPAIVAAIWDQLYFSLWACNTLAAIGVALLLRHALPGRAGLVAAAAALSAAACTFLLLLGPDYLDLGLPVPSSAVFATGFTAYRLAVFLALLKLGRDALDPRMRATP